MTDNLIKRLTAGATGAGNLPKDLYRKDCADALAEIERLRSIIKGLVTADYADQCQECGVNSSEAWEEAMIVVQQRTPPND